jgi:beta-galactosidase
MRKVKMYLLRYQYALLLVLLSLLTTINTQAQRITVSLNGTWQIEDSVSADEMPKTFTHKVPVPGLAKLATPSFPDVDQFQSREYIKSAVKSNRMPASALVETVGVSKQKRNFFWYQTTFTPPQKKEIALLKINKAQFGTAVWLNGKNVGEHAGCFTAGIFNITDLINWNGENRLLVRIGAHPLALPPTVPTGIDTEKIRWTPGIYDDVSLILGDNPIIETLQVAPRINSSDILVQTVIKNYGQSPRSFKLTHIVKTWKDPKEVNRDEEQQLNLQGGEEKTITRKINIPNQNLWSPESPFLYVIETSTGGDSTSARFGMRELRFDTATKKAYLNGKIYYMRGSNITLHRFFEDDNSGSLPWNDAWVRKLLIDIPKRFHWNSFRFCIGPVPDKWLDIADEAGLLIQNEFFVWGYRKEWDTNEVITQYKEWLRDNWNHPSVVIWDACNETNADIMGETIIPAVRPLDLSNRPWDNGYNFPVDPNDPIEDHPYHIGIEGIKTRNYTEFDGMTGGKSVNSPHPSAHAVIANEYGWLWVNRDGSPTQLTEGVYQKLTPGGTAADRIAMNIYMVAALTEYFRCNRNFAGILHFVYLTSSYPGAFTADHFQDVVNLKFQPGFEDYIQNAFNPLGVYIHYWHPTLEAAKLKNFGIMMINDEYETRKGRLVLTLETKDGKELGRAETRFEIPALGQQSYKMRINVPDITGKAQLKATAYPESLEGRTPTVSRRNMDLTKDIPNQQRSKTLDIKD